MTRFSGVQVSEVRSLLITEIVVSACGPAQRRRHMPAAPAWRHRIGGRRPRRCFAWSRGCCGSSTASAGAEAASARLVPSAATSSIRAGASTWVWCRTAGRCQSRRPARGKTWSGPRGGCWPTERPSTKGRMWEQSRASWPERMVTRATFQSRRGGRTRSSRHRRRGPACRRRGRTDGSRGRGS